MKRMTEEFVIFWNPASDRATRLITIVVTEGRVPPDVLVSEFDGLSHMELIATSVALASKAAGMIAGVSDAVGRKPDDTWRQVLAAVAAEPTPGDR